MGRKESNQASILMNNSFRLDKNKRDTTLYKSRVPGYIFFKKRLHFLV